MKKLVAIAVLALATALTVPAADDVKPPVVKHKVEPKYTDEARDARIQGSVRLKVALNARGVLDSIAVEKSLGYGLDQSAMSAVIQWEWDPAMKDGQPVPFTATVEIGFSLQ